MVATCTDVALACSALKQAYREELLVSPEVKLVYLRGNPELISQRLARRQGHYMDPNLLASQFATLEEPEGAIVVDVDADVAEIVASICKSLTTIGFNVGMGMPLGLVCTGVTGYPLPLPPDP